MFRRASRKRDITAAFYLDWKSVTHDWQMQALFRKCVGTRASRAAGNSTRQHQHGFVRELAVQSGQ